MELSIRLDEARKRGLVDDKVRKWVNRSCLRSGFGNGRSLGAEWPALSVDQRKFGPNKFRPEVGIVNIKN